MTDTVYFRNMRPNRVVLQYADLRVVLERRGSREDSVSFPSESLNDSTIARWLRSGLIEQISKDAFLELASRIDAFDPNMRSENEPAILETLRKDPGLPMSQDPRTPTVIDTDKIDRTQLSPTIEYQNTPTSTNDEFNLAPQEVSAQDYHRGSTGRPANLGDSPNQALIGEGNTPNVVDLAGVMAEPATAKKKVTRKSTTPKKKSTKK